MKKIIALFMMMLLFVSSVFAFDASLSVDKTTSDINTPIQLTLTINNDQNWQVAVKEIKWLQNFDIVGQRQFQSSSSKVTIINWKTQSVNTTVFTLLLSLSAKKGWNYIIWPAVLQVWKKEYKTNSVNVKITGAKIMLNNTKNYQPQQNNNQIHNPVWNVRTLQQNTQQAVQQPKIKDFEKEVKKVNQNHQYIYLIIALLLLVWIVVIIYVMKQEKEKSLGKNSNIINEKNGINEELEEIKEIEAEDSKINFEQKPLNYPELDDKEFVSKIDGVFRRKIKDQFNIPNVETKTYDEILSSIPENKKVKEIIDNLKLLKYSNLVADREKLLILVKEL